MGGPQNQPDPASSAVIRDDARLMAALRAGADAALAEIESHYRPELLLFCRRMVNQVEMAEDVVQEVFAGICRLRAEHLPQTSLRGWLYQVARNRCRDVLRRRVVAREQSAQNETEGGCSPVLLDPLTTPAGKALKRDRARRMLRAVQDLDEELRSAIVMRYFQDLPREQIAEALGLSLAGTKARISRAMEVLRERMMRLDDSAWR